MTNLLIIRFEADSDGTGELFVTVKSGGFSGESSAYFTANEIGALATALIEGPTSQINLEGGKRQVSSEGMSGLSEIWVGIYVYPIGKMGRIGVKVSLRADVFELEGRGCYQHVIAELRSDYEPLKDFGKSILDMLAGLIDRAELDAGPFAS